MDCASSEVLTPTTTKPLPCWARYVFSRAGISYRHGSQATYQKLSTTTLPRRLESSTDLPLRSSSVTLGARWPTRGAGGAGVLLLVTTGLGAAGVSRPRSRISAVATASTMVMICGSRARQGDMRTMPGGTTASVDGAGGPLLFIPGFGAGGVSRLRTWPSA